MPDDPANTTDEMSAEDPDKVLEEIERKRSLTGATLVALAAVGITFSLFQIWLAARGFIFEVNLPVSFTFSVLGQTVTVPETIRIGSLQNLQVRAIHVNFALIMAFLLYPTSDGHGVVARNLGRIPIAVRDRLGDHPVTRGTETLQDAVRWLFVDESLDRVTPVDLVLIALSLAPTIYYLTEFDGEITNVIRLFGLRQAAPLGEVYPVLEPIAVGPLATRPFAYLVAVLAILLVLEATRRALGLLLTGLVTLFILYGRFGYLIPRDAPGVGLLATSELRWDQVVQNLWYTVEGILGIPVAVSVQFIYIFILFGAFLEMSGAGKWFIDLAYSLTGTRTGGPAKASVVSSGFMGMISGSSVANTVTTGALTIPLMKRSGYSPEFSGAVESSVSSGGQILPPVMGAAAFLIVEYLAIPYRTVIIAATLPAIAFFFGMWMMVHLEAAKHGIGGLDRSELLDITPHMKHGWFYLVPLGLLLYYIIIAQRSIGRAGWLTIVATVALIALVSAYNRKTGPVLAGGVGGLFVATAVTHYLAGASVIGFLLGDGGAGLAPAAALRAALSQLDLIIAAVSIPVLLARPRGDSPLLELDDTVTDAAAAIDDHVRSDFATSRAGTFGTFVLKSLDNGARTATVVVVAVAAAGIIPGIINITGLGGSLRSLIVSVAGDSLVVLLLLTGVAAIIVGMGMPTTVMYIIIITLLSPTLPEFGVAMIGAHLFVLYLGLMADVTPPVAVAAYAASGIAKSDAFETGRQAFLLSLNKIMVPFAFIFAPGIMLIRVDSVQDFAVLTASDVADVGYFLPEVVVPILGMFAGVYALGPAIIGYYRTYVSRAERVAFTLAALFLSVPGVLLMPAETVVGMVGIQATLYTVPIDVAVRVAGAVLLGGLVVKNRRRADEEVESPADSSVPAT
ncbi:TRAP transporter permease [Natronomonas salina]|uniref:TRAP transporter permease n=1 Tax=Natronomonas salina TaxID=1710540 RepID=UPI0015B57E0E|nr:TRAP transporter fused permease subunit [Natronomonas salina]QLD89962.1 TRAP transporter permease [Natronomonas salina]